MLLREMDKSAARERRASASAKRLRVMTGCWNRYSRLGPLMSLLAIFLLGASARGVPAPADLAGPAVDFVRDVQPIFQSACYKCHDAAKHKGGMRLDSKTTAFIGGDSGETSIVPHDPD